jgi:hypothetical protein
MDRAERVKMMTATLLSGDSVLSTTEAIELAFIIDAEIDRSIYKENIKGQLREG